MSKSAETIAESAGQAAESAGAVAGSAGAALRSAATVAEPAKSVARTTQAGVRSAAQRVARTTRTGVRLAAQRATRLADPRLAAVPVAAAGAVFAVRAVTERRRQDRRTPTVRSLAGAGARLTRLTGQAAASSALAASRGLASARVRRLAPARARRRRTARLRAGLNQALNTLPRAPKAVATTSSPTTLVAAAAPAATYALARRRARRRRPIQRAIDVAVPVTFAYDQWMTLDALPEGEHRIQEIDRDEDGELRGRIPGPLGSREWRAEILDEREHESFAWRSQSGSDCAGLVTFHRLADRLTRIELQLDVVPVRPSETVELALGLADRRADAELRRFKSRVETVSPDAYQDAGEPSQPDHHDDKET